MFIQPTDVKEKAMRIKSIKFNDGFDCYIKWRMTDTCNYSCSYCIRSKTTEAYSADEVATENEELVQVAKDINTLLESSDFSNIKIDLIGGEVTLLDLETILAEITTEKVTEFNITTNFSKSADYYINLAKLYPISLTASLHSGCADKETFFDKAKTVNEANVLKYFKCETVSCSDNQSDIEDFISNCEALGIDYIIDRNKEECITSEMKIASKRTGSAELYTVEFTDGTTKNFESKAEIFSLFKNNAFARGKAIHTGGMMCTCSTNYIYIQKDTVIGRKEGESGCGNKMSVSEFKFLPAQKCTCDFCTLCGRYSLYTADGEELEESVFDVIDDEETEAEEDTAESDSADETPEGTTDTE